MRVRLETLGCRLNEAEAQVWAGEFRQRGCRIADDGEKAELVVVNTCAVTGEAARKSRQLLRRVRRRQPQARVVASGCYASLEPAAAAAAGRTDLLLPNAGKERLVPAALALFDAMTPVPPALPETAVPRRRPRRSRAFVKIQDGCRHRCSYCIVTVARGAERSRPAAETVAEVRRLVAGGVLEVVLTGVHTAGYGAERGGRLDTLVRAILQDTDLPRLRLGSLEPWDLPEDFFRLFEAPRLMPHLHLPLQSGSDKILKRMARRVRTRDYERLAAQARAAHPDMSITTDIVVGFPGEGEREWREGLEFIERMGFAGVHAFRFSARPGTAAARMGPMVPETAKKARSRELQTLASRLRLDFLRRFLNRELPVLWEAAETTAPAARPRAATIYGGYTPNYLRVRQESRQELAHRIHAARMTAIGADGSTLVGVPAAGSRLVE
ncbi:MAG: tRNA (N(6)-L-threonylcarbamoyladenosine(37)-C(2))-methylthiotransferase MtaB [Gammaproteobacteria bacterium]|nr:tRNA (N(6)-L-threonylcarbamoyladenosine(37)-C(2))-methylthiotransferase MtaB [Gammaproteobacteria bacterium]